MDVSSDSTDRQWSVSLIQTKMLPPRLPSGWVLRPASFEWLREQPVRSITVVTAPAGFGKSGCYGQALFGGCGFPVVLLRARAMWSVQKGVGRTRTGASCGRQNSMINSFVDEGAPVRALLQGFRRTSANVSMAEMAYVERLLTAFDAFGNSPTALPVHVEPVPMSPDVLSVREFEVLKCVARGLSNKEIGRLLKLAPETVKWHLKNIFEKLDVSSRIEAVQRVLDSE